MSRTAVAAALGGFDHRSVSAWGPFVWLEKHTENSLRHVSLVPLSISDTLELPSKKPLRVPRAKKGDFQHFTLWFDVHKRENTEISSVTVCSSCKASFS